MVETTEGAGENNSKTPTGFAGEKEKLLIIGNIPAKAKLRNSQYTKFSIFFEVDN